MQTPSPDRHPDHRFSLARIADCARAIAPEFLDSPQYDCEPLSEALGCALTLKVETANPIRSFKARGACWLVHELRRRGETRPLVCASAGNWGQAMAWACRAQGLPLVVHASVNANALKVERMAALGATVLRSGADFDAAKAAARAHAGRIGGLLVEDGLAPEVGEGHATIAMELLARGAAPDAIVVPLGNGALLNGIARWTKHVAPRTQVIGVCAAGAPAMERSWRTDAIVETATADTLADGIAVRVPIPQAVADMRGLVDDVLLVDDACILDGLRLAFRYAGLLLEPSGAAGIAAILAHPARFAGRRVATVLCGGNLTPAQAADWLGVGACAT